MTNSKINVVFTVEQFLELEQKYTGKINELQNQNEELQRQVYELESLKAKEENDEPVEEVTVPEHKRKKKVKGVKDELLNPLITQTVYHDLTDKQKTDDLIKVGENFLRYEVIAIPSTLEAIEQYEYVYKKARNVDDKTIFVKPELSNSPIPNSYASSSLIFYNKYALSLPLDRQEKMFNTLLGVEFSKQNFANWVITTTDRWLFIIYEALHGALLKESYLHSDETRVQVLNEVGKSTTSDSFMWLYCTGKNVNHH